MPGVPAVAVAAVCVPAMFHRVMGNKTFRRLSDFVRHECDIEAECRCRHKGVVDAYIARTWFLAHRWNDALEIAGEHFRCSRCGKKGAAALRPCPTSRVKSFPRWGPQNQTDWKRLTQRLRG
jgi:hypothetical protein